MHGVGKDVLLAAFARAGFPAPDLVTEQAEPDPDFPTVAFPNPEEPGAMDLAFAKARETDPDLVIANDPDADRCAAAVKDGADWRMLRGDEVGALLAAHLVRRGATGTFAESIVSSSLLGRIAEKAGLPYEETLTGFKWIARVDGLRYGYEEALGYCVDPDGVRDKDGITAALLLTELASELKAENRTLLDLLMLEAVRDFRAQTGVQVGVKPAGGIRTSKDAIKFLVLVNETAGEDWLDNHWFRFGASSLLNDLLLQRQKLATGRYSGPDRYGGLITMAPFRLRPGAESRPVVDIAPSYGLFIDGEFTDAAGGKSSIPSPPPPRRCSPRSPRRPRRTSTVRCGPPARPSTSCRARTETDQTAGTRRLAGRVRLVLLSRAPALAAKRRAPPPSGRGTALPASPRSAERLRGAQPGDPAHRSAWATGPVSRESTPRKSATCVATPLSSGSTPVPASGLGLRSATVPTTWPASSGSTCASAATRPPPRRRAPLPPSRVPPGSAGPRASCVPCVGPSLCHLLTSQGQRSDAQRS
ncbi:Deoxyribose-phosphate aldolase [Streptomyces griseoloalbus]